VRDRRGEEHLSRKRSGEKRPQARVADWDSLWWIIIMSTSVEIPRKHWGKVVLIKHSAIVVGAGGAGLRAAVG